MGCCTTVIESVGCRTFGSNCPSRTNRRCLCMAAMVKSACGIGCTDEEDVSRRGVGFQVLAMRFFCIFLTGGEKRKTKLRRPAADVRHALQRNRASQTSDCLGEISATCNAVATHGNQCFNFALFDSGKRKLKETQQNLRKVVNVEHACNATAIKAI